MTIQSQHNDNAGDVFNADTINIHKGNSLAEQMEITFMALKQMPRRLQEAADTGVTSFSFDDARNELERLYAIAGSQHNRDLQEYLEKFLSNYNNYISLLNGVVGGKGTLEEVNKFHAEKIVKWFDSNIRKREFREQFN